MAEPIRVPKLGTEMSHATLVEWKVKEGEWVEQGTTVLEIETAKTKWDVEASVSGFLHIVIPAEDNEVEVSTVVGYLAATKEELASL